MSATRRLRHTHTHLAAVAEEVSTLWPHRVVALAGNARREVRREHLYSTTAMSAQADGWVSDRRGRTFEHSALHEPGKSVITVALLAGLHVRVMLSTLSLLHVLHAL